MRSFLSLLAGVLLAATMIGVPAPALARQAGHEDPVGASADLFDSIDTTNAPPSWLEPRGLNIVDLVGWVPESDLAGAIIQYTPGYGILRYVSGVRSSDTVTITAKTYPRFYADPQWNGSLFGCLGQGARIDELGSVSPASRLRVFAPGGQEITRQVDGYHYVPAGLVQPIRSPREAEITNTFRYNETGWLVPAFAADGALLLPANMGCRLVISRRDYRELTLVFEVEVTPVVSVTVLGRQRFQFPVYSGPGFAGHLNALRYQLAVTCTAKPPVIADMIVPDGADYFLFSFPPVSADPYTAFPHNPLGNVDRPTGATYRVRTWRGLSVDHLTSPGLPLYSHWVDMDQAPNLQYLPYARQITVFEGLETLLPAGISYDPCMTAGACSAEQLARICNTVTPAQMIYLKVERIRAGLSRIPLRMPGPAWQPGGGVVSPAAPSQAMEQGSADARAASITATPDMPYRVYLVGVARSVDRVEPDDPTGCSPNGGCGWFTLDGRMVDYIPAP